MDRKDYMGVIFAKECKKFNISCTNNKSQVYYVIDLKQNETCSGIRNIMEVPSIHVKFVVGCTQQIVHFVHIPLPIAICVPINALNVKKLSRETKI